MVFSARRALRSDMDHDDEDVSTPWIPADAGAETTRQSWISGWLAVSFIFQIVAFTFIRVSDAHRPLLLPMLAVVALELTGFLYLMGRTAPLLRASIEATGTHRWRHRVALPLVAAAVVFGTATLAARLFDDDRLRLGVGVMAGLTMLAFLGRIVESTVRVAARPPTGTDRLIHDHHALVANSVALIGDGVLGTLAVQRGGDLGAIAFAFLAASLLVRLVARWEPAVLVGLQAPRPHRR